MFDYGNPFMAAFNSGMQSMNNLPNLLAQSFGTVNAANQQAQLNNNQLNATTGIDQNREAQKTAKFNAILPLLQQALGGGTNGQQGKQNIKGFQATNFNQGGRLY